jgi:hypothetical protein
VSHGVPKARPALCPVCQRQVPLRRDGRLRAHLAARRSSQREQCAGSGGYSARLELLEGGAHPPAIPPCTAAAAAAVLAEWELADALYREYLGMTELWACDDGAAESVRLAQNRAVDRARELESLYPGWRYADAV